MSHDAESAARTVVVTGPNGFVGARTCAALVDRGVTVRAVVRRAGTAPDLPGVVEYVGEFYDADLAASVVDGASAVVTTVHPMGSDRHTQQRIAVEGTAVLAEAARDAGVGTLVHVSTAGVYDRSPGVGDVDEHARLVPDSANDYAVTKRDTDAALAAVDGITRVLVRPPAILGSGETSNWNAVVPAAMLRDEAERHAVPRHTFAWLHVDDLVALIADVATERIAPASDAETGPVSGEWTAVNVAADRATARDYIGTVTRALGLEPVWEEGPAWTGRILAERAARWGWSPHVSLQAALAELDAGLRVKRAASSG
ncbi:MAG: NAD-dependent epimerase/dehydratase family protein [Actinomycetales bacterium]